MHYYLLPQLSEQWVQSGLIGPSQWIGIVEILDVTLEADGFPMQLSTSILPLRHSSPMSCSSMAYMINFLFIPLNLMIKTLNYLYVSLLYSIAIRNLVTDSSHLDPLYVLAPPKKLATMLSKHLWTTLTATLATCFETSISIIRKLIPPKSLFVQYGRARQLDGGDKIHARELIPLQTDSRDMSFVRVSMMCNNFLSILTYIYISSTSLLLTNLLIDHTKHLNLNFKISLAKYFGLLLLKCHSLLIMGLRHNLLSMLSLMKLKF